MARCMLEYSKMARDMWGYAVRYAGYVQNHTVTAGQSMLPFEARFGEAPDFNRILAVQPMLLETRRRLIL